MTKSTLLLFPALCMSFLLAGCPDDSSEPTTTNADTSTGNDEDTSPDSSASVTIGTTMTSDDTTADTTNMTTTVSTTDATETTDATTETTDNPTTTDAESSSSGSAETTAAESSSSGAMESSSSSGAMESSTTDPSAGTTDTGTMPGEGYGDCANFQDAVACTMDEICLGLGQDATCGLAGCMSNDDCPAGSSGDATPTCLDIGDPDMYCVLDCSMGETCPDGMYCNMDVGVCLWAIEVPPEWTCDATYYGAADGCDCGCAVFDPDCLDATVDSCDYCDDPGSCSAEACPGSIDMTDNSICS